MATIHRLTDDLRPGDLAVGDVLVRDGEPPRSIVRMEPYHGKGPWSLFVESVQRVWMDSEDSTLFLIYRCACCANEVIRAGMKFPPGWFVLYHDEELHIYCSRSCLNTDWS